MKLAEMLLERKSIKEQISTLKERAKQDVRIQEGDEPNELPEKLLGEIEELVDRLEQLVVAINKANNNTLLPQGQSLMEAIARRDMLKLRYQVVKDLVDAASPERDSWRQTKTEVKFKPTIVVADWRRRADSLAKEYRELDNLIQAANWSADLVQE
jgi:hypothetical protein